MIEAKKHPNKDLIVIVQTPGRLMTVDFNDARQLIEQMLLILAQHDQANRINGEGDTQ